MKKGEIMNFIKQYPAISFVLGIIAIIILVVINKNMNSDAIEGEWASEPNSAGEITTYNYKNGELDLKVASSNGDIIHELEYEYKIIKEDEKETVIDVYNENDEKIFRERFAFNDDEAIVYPTVFIDNDEIEGEPRKVTKQ